MNNEEISDIYEGHLEDVQDPRGLKAVSRSLSQTQLLLLFGVLVLFYYNVYVTKAVEFNTAIVWLLIAGGFMYVSNLQQQDELKAPIADRVAKAILLKEIEWKQHNTGELPTGELTVGPYCKLRFLEGKAWKWDIYFEINKVRGGTEMYSAEMHPYTGRIISIKARPEGFTGKEASDIKFIRTRDDVWEDTYGKNKSRVTSRR